MVLAYEAVIHEGLLYLQRYNLLCLSELNYLEQTWLKERNSYSTHGGRCAFRNIPRVGKTKQVF